jgi:sulfonate transport system ATP-binding protein
MHGVGVSFPIRLEIARKVYRRPGCAPVEAVRDLNVLIQGGETVCLIGPSGAGKSTALRILIGLDDDFDGRVWPDPRTIRIGTVFQEPRLLPWRSVEENVRLALPPATRKRSLDALFDELGLTDWLARFPGELSGGMQRRVALARALAIEPVLLVLDEPFVSLDDHAAADLRRFTFGIAHMRKLSVLMVTHNVREALAVADRVILTSPRPATTIADLDLVEPVGNRTNFWIEAQRSELATHYPTTVAP